ncbi:YcjX family protein [Acidomonas methanolica]|uniref:YcjX family protein n=5 Tax=Acidomonas methanolica TaxID=437 RepID=UPI0010462490|nr:YcjX family protein [Acidomonas methanolica]MBU2655219.1 YcjX family protein [Acidomonas methanolica]TCS25610.1 hypothetical protein EDC31_11844 [Acidomonas methanolica]GEK98735.1 hypothetical protein AME01nite_12340 [Acidomonas methanolica NBRC 104435]
MTRFWTGLAVDPRDYLRPATVRIGVTGLARSGKTVLLTALAAALLAPGALGGRIRSAALSDSGADDLPRFPYARMRDALAADPAHWPERTDSVSRLALDITRDGLLPRRALRLEFLDYPGEWLLDLPMIAQDFAAWSRATLARLAQAPDSEAKTAFLAFAQALPARAEAGDAVATTGHRLYSRFLHHLRETDGLSFLQPGRFLMPPPGPAPAWMDFFPLDADSPLSRLLASRFDAYRAATENSLVNTMFGRVDRLIVLADVLGALHTGPVAFADAREALGEAAQALRRQSSWAAALGALMRGRLPPPAIRRVAFAASKADHVAERQRHNLRALMGALTESDASVRGDAMERAFAVAALRCTEDFVWTLDGHPVSAVRGRLMGDDRMTRSYPGEVPPEPPGPEFWTHPFLALPDFEPGRLPLGRQAMPTIGIDDMLLFLLEDVL